MILASAPVSMCLWMTPWLRRCRTKPTVRVESLLDQLCIAERESICKSQMSDLRGRRCSVSCRWRYKTGQVVVQIDFFVTLRCRCRTAEDRRQSPPVARLQRLPRRKRRCMCKSAAQQARRVGGATGGAAYGTAQSSRRVSGVALKVAEVFCALLRRHRRKAATHDAATKERTRSIAASANPHAEACVKVLKPVAKYRAPWVRLLSELKMCLHFVTHFATCPP